MSLNSWTARLIWLLATLLALGCRMAAAPAAYEYEISWPLPASKQLHMLLSTAPQTETYTDVAIAAWRPGRYILQDYAAAVSHVEASDERGRPLRWEKRDKHTWRIWHGSIARVQVRYRYYADNPDAGSSLVGMDQVFINPVNCSMYVPGRLDSTVRVRFTSLPAAWKTATALRPGPERGVWEADSWHDWADSPIILAAAIHQLQFRLDSTRFYLHFHNYSPKTPEADSAILRAVRAICREQGALFGGFPFREYHFLYRFVESNMRHAVEHSNSSSYAMPVSVTGSGESLVSNLSGITSHELFHAWNVKRIRPAALWPYDYSGPQYTGLHWLTEGITDYYASLVTARAGIDAPETFIREISQICTSLDNGYAASQVSPYASSFNSWLDNSPYKPGIFRISFYTLGYRLGWMMDLELRRRTDGRRSLDDLMRALYRNYYLQGKGVPEDGVIRELEALSGDSWADFDAAYVRGTQQPDYRPWLQAAGLRQAEASLTVPQALGIQRIQARGSELVVAELIPESDAAAGGLAPGDVLLEVDGRQAGTQADDALWGKLRKGGLYRVTVLRQGSPLALELRLEGRYEPAGGEISLDPDARPKAAQFREAWLAPLAR
ncbi:MAG: PDZ domain-containing protein [Bacteroidia bacterium]|nr:PDZ domain-containing protein [Bacteroidia bacterium]